MDLLLVRYAEMGLKSRPVRRRFEQILLDNIMDALASARVQSLISTEYGRIYVKPDPMDRAIQAISKVFGVASLSPVIECSSDMGDIMKTAADLSVSIIGQGQSFAVRSRREGVHPYTSMDLNREVGSAIWRANEDKQPSVDLEHPDAEIFVEVRGSRAFVFHQSVPGPGGLPLGSQGKVVAFVDERRDVLAAWMMMKRGCRTAVISDDADLVRPLRPWDPNLRIEPASNIEHMLKRWGALGTVYGYTFSEIHRAIAITSELPVFFPLMGMGGMEIEVRLEAIGA